MLSIPNNLATPVKLQQLADLIPARPRHNLHRTGNSTHRVHSLTTKTKRAHGRQVLERDDL